MESVLLIYDAPPNTNPCAVCRASGMIHLQGSAWLARPFQLHSDAIRAAEDKLRSAGGRWNAVAFSSSEAAAIAALARETLEREVLGIRETLRELLTKSSLMLAAGETREKVKSHSYSALWRAKRSLVAAETAAQVFDLMRTVSTLIESVRATVAAEQSAYLAEYSARPEPVAV